MRLQRSTGNRATVALLAAGRSPASAVGAASEAPSTLQRRGKKKPRRAGKKKGRGGGQQQQGGGQQQRESSPQMVTQPTPSPTQQGWLGTFGGYASSFGSMLWGSTTSGTEGEGNVEGGDLNPGGLGYTAETDIGGEKEPEEAPKDLLNGLMDIPRVAVKLEKEFGGGGKVSGSGDVSRQGASGKAKLEWMGALHQSDSGPLKLLGDNLTGKGTFFAGLKTGGEVEGKVGLDDKGGLALGSKGKLAAFAGVEMKGETEVLIQVGAHETKMKGALGLTIGVGGELSYWLNFEGGMLKWGTKGKGALGVGASWEYQLELPVASVSTSMWSWMAAGMSGLGSGVMSGLRTAADYLEYYGFLGG
jgi:hypothetical protein